jgi:all-trans-retinol dehydrogenase (NAD+)
MVAHVEKHIGAIDTFINNAGVAFGKRVEDYTDAEIQCVMETNASSVLYAARELIPLMRERKRGHFVIVSSIAGFQGVANLSAYVASKFASYGISDCIRHELYLNNVASDVHCTVVCPYLVSTGMFDGVAVPWASQFITGPPLEPAYVADITIKAVCTKRPVVVLPAVLSLMHAMRLLPTSWMDFLSRLIRAAFGMVTFRGRPAQFSLGSMCPLTPDMIDELDHDQCNAVDNKNN